MYTIEHQKHCNTTKDFYWHKAKLIMTHYLFAGHTNHGIMEEKTKAKHIKCLLFTKIMLWDKTQIETTV